LNSAATGARSIANSGQLNSATTSARPTAAANSGQATGLADIAERGAICVGYSRTVEATRAAGPRNVALPRPIHAARSANAA